MVGLRLVAATAARLRGDPSAFVPQRVLALLVGVEHADLLVLLVKEAHVVHLLALRRKGLAQGLLLLLAQLRALLLEHLLEASKNAPRRSSKSGVKSS